MADIKQEEIRQAKQSLSLLKLLWTNGENEPKTERNPDWQFDQESLTYAIMIVQAHLDSLCEGVREETAQ